MSYKDKVLPIVQKTRDITLPSFGVADIIEKKSVHPSDILTELDGKVEKFLREELAKIYPDISFVGEEEGGDRSAKRFWLCDPIDGTGHYMRGLPFCTTMLALIEDGVVNFSVVYDFVNDKMYWAERGKGAYCNYEPMHVSDRTLSDGYICEELRLSNYKTNSLFTILEGKAGYFHSINAGWEFAMIAMGKLEARVCFDPWGKDYDFAPGSLLVSEAGGKVTNIGSESYDYSNRDFIAANPKVHAELVEIFKNQINL